ncbi:MAG: peptidoglycan DD-metalloendopeptidase family protein [bacterium]|nr:peptidoglycan DD-metalloendopeptidase family protein [bacterium]
MALSPAVLQISAAPPVGLEQKIEETRKVRQELLEEQRKLQAELDVISQEGQSLASTVRVLDTTRRKLLSDISLTQSKITSTDQNIRVLEGTLTEKSKEIIIHRGAIAATLQALYHYDSRPLALDLLSTNKLSDTWQDRGRLEDLSGKLEWEIDTLRKTRTELSQKKELTEKKKDELLGLKGQLGGQKEVVEESKSAKERLLAQTRNKEAEYQKLLAEITAKREEAEAELFRFESELKFALDPELIPLPEQGILSWPLDYVYVTQRFGKTSGSARLYASGTHNGVDFRASMGTPVRAMLGGVVEGAGNTDEQRGCYSYGRWILVRHPNGLSSIYSHLSSSVVKKGDTVATGQVIAYSGGMPRTAGAGYSTGPHLHVGLFATQGVSVKQFVQSNYCKQVFVPIAGVEAYLDPLAYLPAI